MIDADGLLVTPGWVDIHTHYDGQATWDPEVSPSGWHGVTTVVMGNCGVGFAPARASDRDWLIQLMEGVEDIPGTALAEGMNWNWETFGEYLDEVERTARVLDVAASSPTARCGPTCSARAGPTTRRTRRRSPRWRRIVREAVHAGAIGASTTRTDPAPGQGRRAGGGDHGRGRGAHRHRRGARQGGAPRLLAGQRHVGPRPRVRLDVGDLHAGRRARHLPGAPGRLRARPVARVDRPRRGGQPARGLAGAPGGRASRPR